MSEQNCFLLSWDCNGLECIVDVNQEHSKATMYALKNQPYDGLESIIHKLMLRARFNSHRNYEIYSVRTDTSITEQTLVQMFETDPNAAAELVRSHGVKIVQ